MQNTHWYPKQSQDLQTIFHYTQHSFSKQGINTVCKCTPHGFQSTTPSRLQHLKSNHNSHASTSSPKCKCTPHGLQSPIPFGKQHAQSQGTAIIPANVPKSASAHPMGCKAQSHLESSMPTVKVQSSYQHKLHNKVQKHTPWVAKHSPMCWCDDSAIFWFDFGAF